MKVLSAKQFYELNKKKAPVEVDDAYKKTVEMVNKVAERINVDAVQNVTGSKKRRKHKKRRSKAAKASVKRPASPQVDVPAKKMKLSMPVEESLEKGQSSGEVDLDLNGNEKNQLETFEISLVNRGSSDGDSEEVLDLNDVGNDDDNQGSLGVDDDGEGDAESDDSTLAEAIIAHDLGYAALQRLIAPCSIEYFVQQHYGLRPYHAANGKRRRNLEYFFSVGQLDEILAQERLFFGSDVRVIPTKGSDFTNQRRRAYRSLVWDEFAIGSNFRLLLPERFDSELGFLMGAMQEFLNGPLYSTLSFFNSQHEATQDSTATRLVDFNEHDLPHGDVFVLLLEGDLNVSLTPPSGNQKKNQKKRKESGTGGVTVMKMTTGDVLYVPMGWKHSVKVGGDERVTRHAVTLCLVNAVPSLVAKFAKRLTDKLQSASPSTNKSLFRHLLESPETSDQLFIDLNASELEQIVSNWLFSGDSEAAKKEGHQEVLHSTLNDLRKEFMTHLAAPQLHASEEKCHATLLGSFWVDLNAKRQMSPSDSEASDNDDDDEDGGEEEEHFRQHHEAGYLEAEDRPKPDTEVRLTRRAAVALVKPTPRGRGDASTFTIYHSLCNSLDVREANAPACLELPLKWLPMVEDLLKSYPDGKSIRQLEGGNLEEQVALTNTLFDAGLIMTTQFSVDEDEEDFQNLIGEYSGDEDDE